MYIAELLVVPGWRGRGLGRALLDTCHLLFPHTRVDLLSTESADRFYEASGFRRFQGFRKSCR
jgi:GNAT superfamily N-acetyltransferase